MRWRSFVPVPLGVGSIAIGLGFVRYWGQYVHFSGAIPNLLDTAWLAVVGGYLITHGIVKDREPEPASA